MIVYDDMEKDDLNFLKENFSDNNKIKIIVNDKNLGAGFLEIKALRLQKKIIWFYRR